VSALQSAAEPGAPPQQSAYRLFRSSDGKSRIDQGSKSFIHDPAAGKTIILDHAKQQAQIVPAAPAAPQMPGMPAVPGMPQMPGMPSMPAPAVHVQDLGKSLLQGHEVEGKKYTIQPPTIPQAPAPPAMPSKPQLPGMPKAPQLPHKPQAPTVAEVWTSPKLQLPMATRVNSAIGQQTAVCQSAIPGEPHPAVFQIPPNYKQIIPKAPKVPKLPV
jgi:hypothetical protein